MKPKGILFQPASLLCDAPASASVLEVALANGLDISHSCGGMGSCTTCRVLVEESPTPLPPRNELEQDIADMRNFADVERLACQLPAIDGLVIRIPERLGEPST